MEKLLKIERQMIYAKANNQKIRYWWYKRKLERIKKKVWK